MSKNTIPASPLTALGPLDGRYSQIANMLSDTFSEYALIQHRIFVEVKWLEVWVNLSLFSTTISDQIENFGGKEKVIDFLENLISDFSIEDAQAVKEIESITNHDVKACELFVAKKLDKTGLGALKSYVHICCTSEDITNLAYALMLIKGKALISQEIHSVLETLRRLAIDYANTPMLSHTHGQPATPTTFGKEMGVFLSRLETQLKYFEAVKIYGKLNGASGNYAAGVVAFPMQRWRYISYRFVRSLHPDLHPNLFTTQIEPHDYISRLLNELKLTMQIVRDLDQDMWSYISRDYLTQKIVATEVGSSTMPHKVNPIAFENSESNIKVFTGLCNALADELPRSRMQRDLSDSSLLRNLGLVFGYAIQTLDQTCNGLNKIEVNEAKMLDDLDKHPEVVSEAIQTVLRTHGVTDAYNRLKAFTRGKDLSKSQLLKFINDQPELTYEESSKLQQLCCTPGSYVGLSKNLALAAAGEITIGEFAIALDDR